MNAATSALSGNADEKPLDAKTNAAAEDGGGFDLGQLVGAATSAHKSGTMDASTFSALASAVLSKQAHAGHTDAVEDSDDDLHAMDRTVQTSDANVSSREIGASAALSAIASVLGGSKGSDAAASAGSAESHPLASDGANLQSQLIGVAMAHASDLFESKQAQGLLASASKNEAVQQAGEMVAKMVMKQKVSCLLLFFSGSRPLPHTRSGR